MRGLGTFYVKELRENRTAYAIVLGVTLLLYAYIVTRVEGEGSAIFLSVFPIWTTLLILPFVLVHAFSVEWRGMSHYTLLSLPLPRWSLATVKCLAVMTAGVAVTGIAAAGILLTDIPMPTTTQLLAQMGKTPKTMMIYACGQYLSFLTLCLGVAMGAVGVGHATKRWRGLAIAGFLITGFYLFLNYLPVFSQALVGQVGMAWTTLLYPATFGAGFMILGIVLFDQKAEI